MMQISNQPSISHTQCIASLCTVFLGISLIMSNSAYAQVTEIPVPEDPMKMYMSYDDSFLYVPSFVGSTITIIDTQTNKIVDQIILENSEQAMTVLPVLENDRMYVPIFEAGKINVYSMKDHSLEDVIFMPESTIVHETPPI